MYVFSELAQHPERKAGSSTQCFPQITPCCACFSDYGHFSWIQGYLYWGGGGYVLSGHCSRQQISVKLKGYLFSKGYLFTEFYGNFQLLIFLVAFFFAVVFHVLVVPRDHPRWSAMPCRDSAVV